MVEILVPDPSLVVLVGAAGAGKSTFAARHFDAAEILSSDRYREIVSGDETDQRATRAAFGRLHRDLARRLADGRLAVVDATNVESWARRTLVRRASVAAVPALAIVLDLPAATVLARNAARTSRFVDVPVVVRHLARLRRGLDGPAPPILAEGFATVVIIRDAVEVDDTTIRRWSRAPMDLPR
ncbi:MAG: AAA family ATPase [Chloroflexota bacterium]